MGTGGGVVVDLVVREGDGEIGDVDYGIWVWFRMRVWLRGCGKRNPN